MVEQILEELFGRPISSAAVLEIDTHVDGLGTAAWNYIHDGAKAYAIAALGAAAFSAGSCDDVMTAAGDLNTAIADYADSANTFNRMLGRQYVFSQNLAGGIDRAGDVLAYLQANLGDFPDPLGLEVVIADATAALAVADNFVTSMTDPNGAPMSFDGAAGIVPALTLADFQQFLLDTAAFGASALPAGEITAVDGLNAQLGIQITGQASAGAAIAAWDGLGDTGNESALFPASGELPGTQVVVRGVANRWDNIDMFDSALATFCIDTVQPQCGDGSVDPWEGCDDRNTIAGDGCSETCQSEPLSGKDLQQCIYKLNRAGGSVAKTQGKESLRCIKGAAAGKVSDAQACLTSDDKQKVERAKLKTVATETKSCRTPPEFGPPAASAVNEAAVSGELAVVADILGSDLTASIILSSSDSAGAACQIAVAKAADKLLAAELRAFFDCKKRGLKDGTVSSAASLSELCFGAIETDIRGKIAKAVSKLSSTLTRRCAAVDLEQTLPGLCAGAADAGACIITSVGCRACRMLEEMDDIARDCDALDDGSINGTCAP